MDTRKVYVLRRVAKPEMYYVRSSDKPKGAIFITDVLGAMLFDYQEEAEHEAYGLDRSVLLNKPSEEVGPLEIATFQITINELRVIVVPKPTARAVE
jgi:hypothetical protein